MKLLYPLFCAMFPERCPYCGVIIESGRIACDNCLKKLDSLQKPIVRGTFGYRCISSFLYDGLVRRMILRIKYHERIQYLPQIAVIMAKDIRKEYGAYHFDMISAVPMHKKDLQKRGYNQAVLLAKALSKLLEIPYADTLTKIKHTKKQQQLKYAQRKKNLIGAFEVIDKELIKEKSILMIDDIITTGITLGACCKTLNRAKPRMLCCATIANANQHLPESAII